MDIQILQLQDLPGENMMVDMTSIALQASREVYNKLKEKGILMIDAPVSGGEPKAIDGTLAIMVGGDESAFESVKEILLKMGSTAVLWEKLEVEMLQNLLIRL